MLARMGLWVREISFSDAAAVAAVRPDHRAHLAELLERGRLRMSGP
ncbi:MAG: hypothetical protein JWO69_1375, partial [Thermoleophilia bacterium]|nr:hypothetical protein [Thermoleophilia bacterium]